MLYSVVVPFLLFLGKGGGSKGMDFSELDYLRGRPSMSQLDGRLKKVIKNSGVGCWTTNDKLLKVIVDNELDTFDAFIKASSKRNPAMDSKHFVKKALRMKFTNILIFAQSKLLLSWEHPRDHHWFYAHLFATPWLCEGLWEDVIFDWETHWEAILEADNVEFFKYARCNLSLSHLNAKKVPSQHTLIKWDAAKILRHLEMDINPNNFSIEGLMDMERINTLRLLYEKNAEIPDKIDGRLWCLDPDVLNFVLSIKDEINVPWLVDCAERYASPDALEVLYYWRRKFPLRPADLTRAAEEGYLSVFQWAWNIGHTMRVDKDCVLKIMNRGRVAIFEFLYSHGEDVLPEAYQEKEAHKDTMWHHDMIVKLYEIDKELVPLGLLHHHALKLKDYKTALWTGRKAKDGGAIMKNDVKGAIKFEEWSFVRWAVARNPKLIPKRKKLFTSGGDLYYCKDERKLEMRREFLVLLLWLYQHTMQKEYLPTVKELKNQPVKYVQRVYIHDPEYLSREDLIKLCASKEVGVDVHEWLFGPLDMNVATLEMANAAMEVENLEALNWIIERNPKAFPSIESIKDGLSSIRGGRKEELVTWIFDKRPKLLEYCQVFRGLLGGTVPPELMEAYKEQYRQQMDQENAEEAVENAQIPESVRSLPSFCTLI